MTHSDGAYADDSDAGGEPAAPTRVPGLVRVGRYELVYELGSGGMATVYLARARGAAGFYRWCAVKRIHRHLAKDRRFVHMFLDEARISALVQHPNVAQVFDVGEDKGEHFIAMEYMHGENLGAVVTGALKRWDGLPLHLGMRIVAAAADGLHQAHEARDAQGRPLGLVHRDVSPENIFVTYDGQVKITDFGIAKAANRITQTKTGGMKGKAAFMAPEQALGKHVDRRSDVFALGIVLWEITTGKRLFKAETDAQTLMRVTSGRITKPSSVVADYPPELERIVLRALSIRPEDRYQSAAALARDLEHLIAERGTVASRTELSGCMQQLFTDRIAIKHQLLQTEGTPPEGMLESLAESPSRSEVVFKEDPARVGVMSADGTPILPASPMDAAASQGKDAGRPRRLSSRGLAILAVVALVLGAAIVTTRVLVSSVPTTRVRVDTQPSGAAVFVDDAAIPVMAPATLPELGMGRHRLRVELRGYESLAVTFDAEGERMHLSYTLHALDEAGSGTALPEPIDRSNTDPQGSGSGAQTASGEGRPAVNGDPGGDGDQVDPTETTPGDPGGSPGSEPGNDGDGTPNVRRPRARPAHLNLVSQPWASVTINGQPAGNTPIYRQSIPSGRVTIRLRALGTGPARTLRLRVRPGETVSRNIPLD